MNSIYLEFHLAEETQKVTFYVDECLKREYEARDKKVHGKNGNHRFFSSFRDGTQTLCRSYIPYILSSIWLEHIATVEHNSRSNCSNICTYEKKMVHDSRGIFEALAFAAGQLLCQKENDLKSRNRLNEGHGRKIKRWRVNNNAQSTMTGV